MGERLAPTTAERFVGRVHELDQVASVWGDALQGQGSVVVVSGEPGVGKTRLCQEAANRACGAGLKVVTARCWVHAGAPALWPWRLIMRELRGDRATDLLASDTGAAGAAGAGPERFERFVAVTERLVSAAAEQPVCLVIDDIHAADAGTLLLVRFVARSLDRLPLALVVSRRSGEPAGGYEAELLDDIESEATPLVLQNLDQRDAEALLAVHGLTDLEPDLLRTLVQVTGGNPLFLRRIAALGAPRARAGGSLPRGLHVAIEEVTTRLSPEARRVLQECAVLGLGPSVQEAVTVARTEVVGVLDAVAEASPTGLVSAEPPDRFTFGHELVRATFEAALTPADRMDAYARAAVGVGDGAAAAPSDRLARRAHYALAAAPRSADDARLAVSACRESARSMMRSFAYEQGDNLLSAAVELHDRPDLGPAPSQLLVDWADAALACGWTTEAHIRFDRAVTAAQREGNPVALAEAALGLGGHGVYENRALVDRTRVLGLQRAALDALPKDEEHDTLRLRLEARLAAEAVYDGGQVDAVYEVLDRVRKSGDPTGLAEVLALCHHVSLTPDRAEARLALADELIRVASEAGYGVLGLTGLHFRAFDLFHLGDERALAALEELRERATALGAQHMLYLVGVVDVMLCFRAGRLDEAAEQARRCREQGEALGAVNDVGYLGAQMMAIYWARGGTIEQAEMAEKVAASPSLVEAELSFRAVAAGFAVRAGQPERARAILDQIDIGDLRSLDQSSSWMVTLTALVDAAAALGDKALAADGYELLLPYARLPTIGGFAVVCLGATERALGVAALTFGDRDRAVAHLERAVVENRRLGNRPLLAVARADLARALARLSHPDVRSRAAGLLDRAIAEGDEMGMTARVTTWRDERSDLDREPEPGSETGSTGGTRHGLVHQMANGWLVAVGDHVALVGDLIGMRYLVELLTRPGELIPAARLADQGSSLGDPTPRWLLDEARIRYAARAQELARDIEEAEAHNDIGRADMLRVELDSLLDQLEAAAGRGDRPPGSTDHSERARTAVGKAIRRAVDAIAGEDSSIADMIRPFVTTGSSCSYAPPSDAWIKWSARLPTPADS